MLVRFRVQEGQTGNASGIGFKSFGFDSAPYYFELGAKWPFEIGNLLAKQVRIHQVARI